MKRWQQNDPIGCGFRSVKNNALTSPRLSVSARPIWLILWRQSKSELIFREEHWWAIGGWTQQFCRLWLRTQLKGAQCQSIKLGARLFLCWPHASPPAGLIEECLCLLLLLSLRVNTPGQVYLCPVNQTHSQTLLSLIKHQLNQCFSLSVHSASSLRLFQRSCTSDKSCKCFQVLLWSSYCLTLLLVYAEKDNF